jgi:hypothetical protein
LAPSKYRVRIGETGTTAERPPGANPPHDFFSQESDLLSQLANLLQTKASDVILLRRALRMPLHLLKDKLTQLQFDR